jgi:hypothetical protein
VMQLMKNLQNLPVQKIVISTRPELGEQLEKEFEKERLEILPLSREEQEVFLVNSWQNALKGLKADLRRFSAKLLDSINQSVADEEFTGTPLATKLISEIYMDQAQSGTEGDNIEGASSLYELFNKFLEEKIRINNEDKIKLVTSNVQAKRLIEMDRNLLIVACQNLALPKVFSSEELERLAKTDHLKIDQNEFLVVLKYGLVTGSLGNEKFIHKTIAEFFALLYLIKRLDQEDIFLFFIRVVLVEKRFQVIRAMFESSLNGKAKLDFNSHITKFGSNSSKFDDLFSALCVACSERKLKTAETIFLFLINTSDYQFAKLLVKPNSSVIPYLLIEISGLDFLNIIDEKFGTRFVRVIFQTTFECEDGSESDILSLALLNGGNLGKLLNFIRNKLLPDTDLIDFCFLRTDGFGSNFIQKVLNLKSAKQKVEACKELLEIQRSGKVKSMAILNHFRNHLIDSDSGMSLLVDALRVGDTEALELLLGSIAGSVDFPEICSRILRFGLSQIDDPFNIFQPLVGSLNPELVKTIFDQTMKNV